MTPETIIHWQPIDTAPRDTEKPIWVYYDAEAVPDYDPETDEITDYGCYSEACMSIDGKGICEAVWYDEETIDESGEGWGPWTVNPGYWFTNDGNGIAVPATHWINPQPPQTDQEKP